MMPVVKDPKFYLEVRHNLHNNNNKSREKDHMKTSNKEKVKTNQNFIFEFLLTPQNHYK